MDNINASSQKFYGIFSGQEKELTNEKPEAGGQRFYVSAGNFNVAQVVDYIWEHYPERAQAKGIPKGAHKDYYLTDTAGVGYPTEGCYTSDNSASKRVLGIEYRSFESTLKDQLAQFVALEKQLEGSDD
ncbi:methylglyoxal reductase (NADPH-dependent) gre2 [Ceratobasidium sp. 370]|nr:methylglyoxal reductase (NADPH-dependent) gre2 [Ceratobasidium sp. 370]